jgi:hypothetical protein
MEGRGFFHSGIGGFFGWFPVEEAKNETGCRTRGSTEGKR